MPAEGIATSLDCYYPHPVNPIDVGSANDYFGVYMIPVKTSFTLLLGFMSPAWGHEFWIEPRAYTLPVTSPVEADLMVGSEFLGLDYIFIPKGYVTARFASPSAQTDLEFTGQDNPSLSLATDEPGLHAVVLISRPSSLKHDDYAAFLEFAETVGRGPDIVSARRDGPIQESYFRYAKALVGVGDSKGRDAAFGAIYEWVALDNPYTATEGPVEFKLLFEGNAAADEPVQIFARDPAVKSKTLPIHLKTNADGVLELPNTIRGEIMLNSVKLLPVQNEGRDWVSYWASITFAR